MITKIELSGFKTFQNFTLELAPFQVIVGVNGVGKSNLFDALRLLSRLADHDLRTAFQDLRGEGQELFTRLPTGHSAKRMCLAVEILVARQIRDDWGVMADLKYPRLRYELEISQQIDERGLKRLYVDKEVLKPIPRGKDRWLKQHGTYLTDWLPKLTGGRIAFISTDEQDNHIALHQDGGRQGRTMNYKGNIERTILSGINNTEFPFRMPLPPAKRCVLGNFCK